MSNVKNLRQDITGLRAVAVISVTVFHIFHVLFPGSNLFQGGFLGVDIFFVISGYLMTMIIMNGIDRGSFSFYDFYKRRAQRICPALLVTVVFFSIIAVFLMDGQTLKNTTRDGAIALGFVSNIWFALKTGYFDAVAGERPFLHTWSLSVEWQFYLLYPLLIVILSKFLSRKNVGISLIILSAASMIFGCILTEINSTFSYFFLPSRAFALLIGGLAYFYPLSLLLSAFCKNSAAGKDPAKAYKYAEFTGLALIGISLLIVTDSNGWPNIWSALPLLGTYLCIAADNKDTVLKNPVVQKTGLWSYSLYLVHWPVIVFFSQLSLQEHIWIMIVLIMLLGVTLHYTVENRRNYGRKFLVLYFAAAGVVVFVKETAVPFLRNELSLCIPTLTVPIKVASDQMSMDSGNTDLPAELILIGDSFAETLRPTFAEYFGDRHIKFITVGGCYSSHKLTTRYTPDNDKTAARCDLRFSVLEQAAEQYPHADIIWIQDWSRYDTIRQHIAYRDTKQQAELPLEELIPGDLAEAAALLDNGLRKVYIIGSNRRTLTNGLGVMPNYGQVCYAWKTFDTALSNMLFNKICRERIELQDVRLNKEISEAVKQLPTNKDAEQRVIYIDPSAALCENSSSCRVITDTEHAYPMFSDGSHLSSYGAPIVAKFLIQQTNHDYKEF